MNFILKTSCAFYLASQVEEWIRICLPMQKVQVHSLDQEDPLEKEMATHSSILARKIPGVEEGAWQAYSPWGCKELDTI